MVSSSEIQKEHENVLLNDLFKHPGFEVLMQRIDKLSEEDALTLANTILHSGNPIDQRRVDEKRGFWRGVEWFIRETKKGARVFERMGEE